MLFSYFLCLSRLCCFSLPLLQAAMLFCSSYAPVGHVVLLMCVSTSPRPAEVMDDLRTMVSSITGRHQPMLSEEHHGIIMRNADVLNSAIIYDRDFSYNYFGFKVMQCEQWSPYCSETGVMLNNGVVLLNNDLLLCN